VLRPNPVRELKRSPRLIAMAGRVMRIKEKRGDTERREEKRKEGRGKVSCAPKKILWVAYIHIHIGAPTAPMCMFGHCQR